MQPGLELLASLQTPVPLEASQDYPSEATIEENPPVAPVKLDTMVE